MGDFFLFSVGKLRKNFKTETWIYKLNSCRPFAFISNKQPLPIRHAVHGERVGVSSASLFSNKVYRFCQYERNMSVSRRKIDNRQKSSITELVLHIYARTRP